MPTSNWSHASATKIRFFSPPKVEAEKGRHTSHRTGPRGPKKSCWKDAKNGKLGASSSQVRCSRGAGRTPLWRRRQKSSWVDSQPGCVAARSSLEGILRGPAPSSWLQAVGVVHNPMFSGLSSCISAWALCQLISNRSHQLSRHQ